MRSECRSELPIADRLSFYALNEKALKLRQNLIGLLLRQEVATPKSAPVTDSFGLHVSITFQS